MPSLWSVTTSSSSRTPCSGTSQLRAASPSRHTPLCHKSRPSPYTKNSTEALALRALSSTPTRAVKRLAWPSRRIMASELAWVPMPCAKSVAAMRSGVPVTDWRAKGLPQPLLMALRSTLSSCREAATAGPATMGRAPKKMSARCMAQVPGGTGGFVMKYQGLPANHLPPGGVRPAPRYFSLR